jgi:CDP-diacylglycerol--glycerol-3-phosphate 3-phosphatidyltransferase
MHLLKESTKIYWHDRLLWKYFIKHIPVQIRPNHITAARFILTPLVVWLVWRGDYAWGVPLFAVTSFTDTIDGTMARMRGQITKWGIVFDPIADKLLVSSVLLVLIVRHLSFYLGIAIIAIEIIVALAGLYSYGKDTVFMANNLGKTKMCLQVFGLGLLLLGVWLNYDPLHWAAIAVLFASLVFAIANIMALGVRKAI